jgi:hypothetical protein
MASKARRVTRACHFGNTPAELLLPVCQHRLPLLVVLHRADVRHAANVSNVVTASIFRDK